MKALIATACLLAVFGSAVPAQAQIVQIGNLEISEDVFEGIPLTNKSPVESASKVERVQAQGQQESWMARNWKWFVPVIVVVGVGAAVAAGGSY